jgi:O-antigen/teichoic acid export membrane protein
MLAAVRSVFWVGSGTVFNLLVWVVSGKVIALSLGPAGVGTFGLLRQLAQNLNVIATFNGSTTLVQGIASRPADRRRDYARNVLLLFAGLAVTVSVVLLFGAPWIGGRLLGGTQPAAQLRWMIVPLVGMSASAYFLGVLNGYRNLKALVLCQAVGPLSALALIVPVVSWAKRGGIGAYCVILGVPYALIGAVAATIIVRKGWLSRSRPEVTHTSLRADSLHFFGLSSALLLGGVASTGTQLFLNFLVLTRLGLAESGQFWVAWSLSMTYVTLLLSSFGAYYLPTLSATQGDEKRSLVMRFTRLTILAMPLLVATVVVCKFEMVRVLFSGAMLPSLRIFRWMLIGDFFKALSWVWAFPMLAFAEGKTFAVVELTTNCLYAALVWIGFALFPSAELIGQLFVAIYILYSITVLVYLNRVHSIRLQKSQKWGIFRGILVIAWASALFWNEDSWHWGRIPLALIPALVNLWMSLHDDERRILVERISAWRRGRVAPQLFDAS